MKRRLVWLDLLKTLALVGMAVFHFNYDLEMLGLTPVGTMSHPAWVWFARIVAGSFVTMAGMSLWLAHARGFRPRAFLRRFIILGLAALAITVATRLAMPEFYIFFGILHLIALSSVLGLPFLFVPSVVTALAALAVFILPQLVSGGVFNTPTLWFLGLQDVDFATADYEPIFPWFGLFLAGIVIAKTLDRLGMTKGQKAAPPPLVDLLAWPGRHSLGVYLIHQPVIFGSLYLFALTR